MKGILRGAALFIGAYALCYLAFAGIVTALGSRVWPW